MADGKRQPCQCSDRVAGWSPLPRRRRGGGVSGLCGRGPTRRLGDLASLDATRADVHPLGRVADLDTDPLDIRIPASLRAPVGVAEAHAEYRFLIADVANGGHFCTLAGALTRISGQIVPECSPYSGSEATRGRQPTVETARKAELPTGHDSGGDLIDKSHRRLGSVHGHLR